MIAHKKIEVAELRETLKHNPAHPVAKILHGELPIAKPVNFKAVLQTPGLSVIAEIKRQSPSNGVLASIPNPITLAEKYIAGGASALSILTDRKFFGGDLK